MITIHQRYRQTDRHRHRQTDRQTTCDRNTALCTKVHRAVKIDQQMIKSNVWPLCSQTVAMGMHRMQPAVSVKPMTTAARIFVYSGIHCVKKLSTMITNCLLWDVVWKPKTNLSTFYTHNTAPNFSLDWHGIQHYPEWQRDLVRWTEMEV